MKTLKLPSLLLLFMMSLFTLQSCKKEKEEEINLKDQKFLTMAYSKNSFAMQAAILARTKGTSRDLIAYAEKLSTSSTLAAQQMSTLAQSKGWVIPSNLEPEEQARLDLLNNIASASFDKEYVKEMVSAQTNAIMVYTQGTSEVANPELRNFATTNLVGLNAQLTETNNLNTKLP